MFRHPLFYFAIGTVAFAALSGFLCHPLGTGDILDVEFSANSHQFYETLVAFEVDGKVSGFKLHLLLDFVFLSLYAGFFYHLTKITLSPSTEKSWRWMLWLTPVAAVLDVIENVFLYYYIDNHHVSPWLFHVSFAATVIKFGLIAVNILGVLFLVGKKYMNSLYPN